MEEQEIIIDEKTKEKIKQMFEEITMCAKQISKRCYGYLLISKNNKCYLSLVEKGKKLHHFLYNYESNTKDTTKFIVKITSFSSFDQFLSSLPKLLFR